jgi:hypothetical protein
MPTRAASNLIPLSDSRARPLKRERKWESAADPNRFSGHSASHGRSGPRCVAGA